MLHFPFGVSSRPLSLVPLCVACNVDSDKTPQGRSAGLGTVEAHGQHYYRKYIYVMVMSISIS